MATFFKKKLSLKKVKVFTSSVTTNYKIFTKIEKAHRFKCETHKQWAFLYKNENLHSFIL